MSVEGCCMQGAVGAEEGLVMESIGVRDGAGKGVRDEASRGAAQGGREDEAKEQARSCRHQQQRNGTLQWRQSTGKNRQDGWRRVRREMLGGGAGKAGAAAAPVAFCYILSYRQWLTLRLGGR